jgi:hypothetical protein
VRNYSSNGIFIFSHLLSEEIIWEGTILSHVTYKQQKNYDSLNEIAEVDSEQEDENNQ